MSITRPPGATPRAANRAAVPVPDATSRTRIPGQLERGDGPVGGLRQEAQGAVVADPRQRRRQ